MSDQSRDQPQVSGWVGEDAVFPGFPQPVEVPPPLPHPGHPSRQAAPQPGPQPLWAQTPPPLPPPGHPARLGMQPGAPGHPPWLRTPAPPTPPRRRRAPLVVGVLVLVLALVGGLGAVAVRGLVFGDETSGPTPSGTPFGTVAPTTAPSTPTTADGATPTSRPTPGFRGTGRTDNVLYNAAWERDSGSQYCPDMKLMTPATEDARTSLLAIVGCLVSLHQQVLRPVGITIDTPEVKFYRGETTTPCGRIEDSSLGSLCMRDETLYFSLNAAESRSEGYASNPLGYYWIAAHEFGHFVQMRAGILAGGTGDKLTSRRIELQANCMSGMFMGAVWSQIDGDPAKHQGMHSFLRRIYADQAPGQGTHGTPDSVITWYDLGFKWQWASFLRCNTFTAKVPEVR